MGNTISSQSPSSAQDSFLRNRTVSRLGQRVLRGPDWKWDNQDGGEGYVGTLIAIEYPSCDEAAPSPVWVAWDNGVIERYRVSRTGPCDLRLYDSGPAGIHFPSVTCDACCKSGIGGTRWKCSVCCDYELCHACYMADKHSLDHAFLRYDLPDATGIKVAPRKGSFKRIVRGIFEGAKVVRGPHWERGDEDGTDDSIGTVLSVRDSINGTFRSTARVRWSDAKVETHSVGHGGDVALKFVESAAGGTVYVDHMPLIAPIQLKDDSDNEFFTGARVGIILDLEAFRILQHGLGDWVPEMAEVIHKIGVVQDVTTAGDVRVCFGTGERWKINPAALIRVPSFSVGDMVKVVEDLPTLESLEDDDDDSDSLEPKAKLHLDYGPPTFFVELSPGCVPGVSDHFGSHGSYGRTCTQEILGSTGTVTEICNSQDVLVNIDGLDYTCNPLSLALIQRQLDGAGPRDNAAAAGTPCSSEAQKALEERLHELEVAIQCAICMDNPRNVLFLCGHGCCDDCSQALRLCHICREEITKKIPIY